MKKITITVNECDINRMVAYCKGVNDPKNWTNMLNRIRKAIDLSTKYSGEVLQKALGQSIRRR